MVKGSEDSLVKLVMHARAARGGFGKVGHRLRRGKAVEGNKGLKKLRFMASYDKKQSLYLNCFSMGQLQKHSIFPF